MINLMKERLESLIEAYRNMLPQESGKRRELLLNVIEDLLNIIHERGI